MWEILDPPQHHIKMGKIDHHISSVNTNGAILETAIICLHCGGLQIDFLIVIKVLPVGTNESPRKSSSNTDKSGVTLKLHMLDTFNGLLQSQHCQILKITWVCGSAMLVVGNSQCKLSREETSTIFVPEILICTWITENVHMLVWPPEFLLSKRVTLNISNPAARYRRRRPITLNHLFWRAWDKKGEIVFSFEFQSTAHSRSF